MQAQTTTDHQEIMDWVNERDGKPSIVKDTKKGNSGILRIDFPGYTGEDQLEEISWNDFFSIFDRRDLQFLYQEKAGKDQESRFNKFVSKDAEAVASSDGDKNQEKKEKTDKTAPSADNSPEAEDVADDDPLLTEEDLAENDLSIEEADDIEWDEPEDLEDPEEMP